MKVKRKKLKLFQKTFKKHLTNLLIYVIIKVQRTKQGETKMENNNTNNEIKALTFEQCCRIWDGIQKLKARESILKKDREKRTLTHIEKLDKWVKLGHAIVKNDIAFAYHERLGCTMIVTKTHSIIGATISDWLKMVGE